MFTCGMPCHSNKCSRQSCPDIVQQLSDTLACLKVAVGTLQTQVGQLKTRTDFIWCKTKPLVEAEIVDRLNEVESDLETLDEELDAAQDAIDALEADTEVLRTCGILTLDCESSDSDSSSFSDSLSDSFSTSG